MSSPGIKPLQLPLAFDSILLSRINYGVIKTYFRNSNITRLYMDYPFEGVDLSDLLELLPHLQTLALINFDILVGLLKPSSIAVSPRPPYLEPLRILHCIMGVPELKAIAETHPIKNLIIWSCCYRLANGRIVSSQAGDREAYFGGIASVVKFIDAPPPNRERLVLGVLDRAY
ncbi:hypothetical protein B0J17DRAFT_718548 [Rhizoctonia solani]|nr:hypothetical protein B0J17DRAFT_718548 [Rhizoctonia solani]